LSLSRRDELLNNRNKRLDPPLYAESTEQPDSIDQNLPETSFRKSAKSYCSYHTSVSQRLDLPPVSLARITAPERRSVA
jgi:hypothetical protein